MSRSFLRRSLAWTFALLVTLAAAAGDAWAEGSRVVIVRRAELEPRLEATHVRLASELRSAGFEVDVRVVESDEDARAAVESAPGEAPRFATVLVRPVEDGAATDIWVADAITNKTVVRRIDHHALDETQVAMSAVELMRASLVEPLAIAPPPSLPPRPPPPADVARWIAPPPPPARPVLQPSLDAGVAALQSGDFGPAVGPVLAFVLPLARWLRAQALLVAPAFGAEVAAPHGVATVRQELALVEAAFIPRRLPWIEPFAVLGAGAYHFYARGTARPPFLDGRDDGWAAIGSAGLGASFPLTSTARVVVGGRAIVGAPRPVVRFASERVAAALRPGILASLSLEIDL